MKGSNEPRHRIEYERIINLADDLITIVGTDGYFKYLNPAWEKVLGYTREELLSRPITDFIHPEDRDKVKQEISNLAKGQRNRNFEDRNIHKDGSVRYITWRTTPIPEENLIYAIGRDVTEHRQIEEAIIRERNRADHYFNVAGTMLVAVDDEAKVTRINDKGCEVLGYDRSEIIGKDWFETFIPRGRRSKYNRAGYIKWVIGGLEPKGYHEGDVVTKSGERRLIAWHNTAIKDETGKTIGSLSSGEDITDLKRAEAKAVHLNLVLRAIRNVNQLITREKNLNRLLKKICLALVETRGYYSVRISMVNETGQLVPGAEAVLNEATKNVTVRLGQGEITECQRRARREKGIVVIPNPATECTPCPTAGQHGGCSGLAIRLEHGHRIYGILSASVPAASLEYEEEVELFKELAGDIALALHDIKQEEARREAETALEKSRISYQELFRTMTSGVAVYEAVDDGEDFVFRDFNRAAEEIDGRKRENVIGRRITDVFPGVRDFGLFEVLQQVWRTGEPAYLPDNVYRDESTAGGWRENWLYRLPDGDVVAVYNDISKRKIAEQKLRESEERLSTVLENTLEGCQIIGYDWKYLYMNDTAITHGRQPREKMLGHTMMEAYPGIEDMPIFAELGRCMKERTSRYLAETAFQFPDGSVGWFELYIQPVNEGLLVLSLNITDSRQATEALRESEERYRKLVEASPDAIIIHGLGDIFFVNPAAVTLLGARSAANLIGASVYDLVHPDSMPLVDKRTEALRKNLPIPQQTIKMVRLDGMVLDIEVTALPLEYQGRPAVLAFLHDITRRKQAREAMESRERFLNNVIEHTPNPLWISDEKGTVIRINQALRDLLKITDSSVVGRYNVLEDEQVIEQGLLDKVRSVFEEGKTVNFRIDYYTEREPQIKSSRRAHRILDIVMSAIIDENGKVVNVLCQHKDVTEQVRAEEEHRQLLEYQEMDQLKTNILSTVSHELRTPLAGIKGYATLLMQYKDRLDEARQQESLEAIDRSTDRLTELIDHLLDISRMDAGLLRLNLETVDPGEIIRAAVSELQMRNPDYTVLLGMDEPLPMLMADGRRIREVMDNLLENAVKYSPEGTEIKVAVKRQAKELLISISDQGRGIPPEEQEKIFNRMYRLEQRLAKDPGGLGLGLNLCKALVEAHGGRIWVKSKPEQGSTFYFTLPVSAKKR